MTSRASSGRCKARALLSLRSFIVICLRVSLFLSLPSHLPPQPVFLLDFCSYSFWLSLALTLSCSLRPLRAPCILLLTLLTYNEPVGQRYCYTFSPSLSLPRPPPPPPPLPSLLLPLQPHPNPLPVTTSSLLHLKSTPHSPLTTTQLALHGKVGFGPQYPVPGSFLTLSLGCRRRSLSG